MQPYNNYYPASYGYNPYMQYQPQQQMQAAQSAQSNNGIPWVQGEAGAKAYTIGAGQSVLLMDSESNAFYIKSTDNSGMPLPLRIFDYQERTPQNTQNAPKTAGIDTSLFVTHAEFEERIQEILGTSATKKSKPKETGSE